MVMVFHVQWKMHAAHDEPAIYPTTEDRRHIDRQIPVFYGYNGFHGKEAFGIILIKNMP